MNQQPSIVVNIVEYILSMALPITLTIMLSLAITRGQTLSTFVVFGLSSYGVLNFNKWSPVQCIAYIALLPWIFAYLA